MTEIPPIKSKMPKANKKKLAAAQAPASTSSKLTTSSINTDPILGYKIRVLIHDFLKEAKDPDAQRRINSTTEANYISGPYFDQEQAKQVREATVDVDLPINLTAPTQVNYEGGENEDSDLRVRMSGLTVEEAIKTVMNGFLDKRRASGDARPCGPHDLAPIYAALFGVHLSEFQTFGDGILAEGTWDLVYSVDVGGQGGGDLERDARRKSSLSRYVTASPTAD
ncbi:hypothetical protein BDP81DRAFT_419455 [Colletotrichum phormii]|uniref:Uncharacterized protein n=1 Tax=Colletotrichum phormii TaxID=359342 RepID=A0AAJ0EKL6_9PEZI|nr:uncharacterized protein BDP81DRAFT_419455 [Colletotrichum phormii]KAK1640151.1 hypothetical protein BDP81DRAFT_419455 [Colletotrichum phormii]